MYTLFSLFKNIIILGISIVGLLMIAIAELYIASILIEMLITNYGMDPDYSILIYGVFAIHIIWMTFKFFMKYIFRVIKSLFS